MKAIDGTNLTEVSLSAKIYVTVLTKIFIRSISLDHANHIVFMTLQVCSSLVAVDHQVPRYICRRVRKHYSYTVTVSFE